MAIIQGSYSTYSALSTFLNALTLTYKEKIMTDTQTKNILKILGEAWKKTSNPRILGPDVSENTNDIIRLLNTNNTAQIKSPTGLDIEVKKLNNKYSIKTKGYFQYVTVAPGTMNSVGPSFVHKTQNYDRFLEEVVKPIEQWTSALIKNGPNICNNFSFEGISQNQIVQTVNVITKFDHKEWRDDRDNFIILPLLRQAGRTINHLINS